MKKILLTFTVLSFFVFPSCNGNQTAENNSVTETCSFALDQDSRAQVRWTAFKTSEKLPVGGQFTEVKVMGGDHGTTIDEVLKTLSFSISTASTNTTNPDRDTKIIKSFFGAMDATDLIKGKAKSAIGNNEKGNCIFLLTLNNVEREVNMTYTVEGDKVMLSGEIDVNDFGAEKAVSSLNEVCKDLHTGADGVSKTWSIVGVNVDLFLKKTCE